MSCEECPQHKNEIWDKSRRNLNTWELCLIGIFRETSRCVCHFALIFGLCWLSTPIFPSPPRVWFSPEFLHVAVVFSPLGEREREKSLKSMFATHWSGVNEVGDFIMRDGNLRKALPLRWFPINFSVFNYGYVWDSLYTSHRRWQEAHDFKSRVESGDC